MSPRPDSRESLSGGFDVATNRVDGQTVATIWGEVDVATAPQLWRALETLLDKGEHRIVLDLANLKFIDGSGLRVIAAAQKRCQAVDGELVVRSAPAVTLKLLRLTRLAEMLNIEPPRPGLSSRCGDQAKLLGSAGR
jgi:anti-sigma B factor antagonist